VVPFREITQIFSGEQKKGALSANEKISFLLDVHRGAMDSA
jgi:hypothetical protein